MNSNYTPIERKVQADYDKIADAFYDSRKDMHWPVIDEMIGEVERGQKVLDIGCGIGRLCRQMESKGVEYHGIDISSKEISIARKSCPGGEFVIGSMLELPYEDESFDVVFHIASLHHLLNKPERIRALAEALRVLKKGGQFNLTVMGLWQKKYWNLFFNKTKGKLTLPTEQQKQIKFSDVFLRWSWRSEETIYRYYHAFSKGELKKLFKGLSLADFEIKFMANGKKVPWYKGKNLVVKGRKAV